MVGLEYHVLKSFSEGIDLPVWMEVTLFYNFIIMLIYDIPAVAASSLRFSLQECFLC